MRPSISSSEHDDASVHFALAELARQQDDGDALLRALDHVIDLSGSGAPAGTMAGPATESLAG